MLHQLTAVGELLTSHGLFFIPSLIRNAAALTSSKRTTVGSLVSALAITRSVTVQLSPVHETLTEVSVLRYERVSERVIVDCGDTGAE